MRDTDSPRDIRNGRLIIIINIIITSASKQFGPAYSTVPCPPQLPCQFLTRPRCHATRDPAKFWPTLSSPDPFYVIVISRYHKAQCRTHFSGGLCHSANFAKAQQTCFPRSGVTVTISSVIFWDTRLTSSRNRASGRFPCGCPRVVSKLTDERRARASQNQKSKKGKN